MEIEEKVEKLLKGIESLLEEDEELSEALLPTVGILSARLVPTEGLSKEELDKYQYHFRGFNGDGFDCIITVDFDTMKYLSMLDSVGKPEWLMTDVITSINKADVKLH